MTKEFARALHIAVLVVVAVALTLPFLVHGLISGHDRRVHIAYQHFFNEQTSRGELYPRWMRGLNQGRGSPIFFVQYPLPYYLARGLGYLVPNHWGIYTETHTLGLGVVLATILGALFTYAWCATFVDTRSAMLAALFFLTLPYFFSVDLYLRAAVGEVWALALMPLAFYFVEPRATLPRRSLAGLAAVFALLLLSHIFTAVMLVPVLFAYAAWRAGPGKLFAVLPRMAAALLLGTALAGVYVFPLLAHRHFLHPENVQTLFGANYSPLSQIFPYDNSMFPQDSSRWSFLGRSARCLAAAAICLIGIACYRLRGERSAPMRLILAVFSMAMLGVTCLAGHLPGLREVPGALPLAPWLVDQRAHIFLATFLTLLAGLLCYWSLQESKDARLADFLVVIALVSYWMTTRWSLVIWNTIHPLQTIQFPWRFNILLALATTGLAALAIANLAQRTLRQRVPGGVLAVVVWALVAGGTAMAGYVENAFWKTRSVAYEPARDPALPLYAQVKDLKALNSVMSSEADRPSAMLTSGSGYAEVKMPYPRLIELHARCESGCTLNIGQFYYPAWRARQGEAEIPLRAAVPGGLMEISLPSGESSVVIELSRSWSEKIGPWVSLVALIVVFGFALSDSQSRGTVRRSLAPSTALS